MNICLLITGIMYSYTNFGARKYKNNGCYARSPHLTAPRRSLTASTHLHLRTSFRRIQNIFFPFTGEFRHAIAVQLVIFTSQKRTCSFPITPNIGNPGAVRGRPRIGSAVVDALFCYPPIICMLEACFCLLGLLGANSQ